MKYIVLLVVVCFSTLKGYSSPANRDCSIVSQVQNEIPIKNKSMDSLSNSEIKSESKTIDKSIVHSEESDGKVSWYNLLALFVGIIGLVSTLYSTHRASKINERSNKLNSALKKLEISMSKKSSQLSNEVKRLEIKMRTSDLIVAKRLEVFPKLHILTDTLGAAIRYYNNHISDEEKKEWNTLVLKREIKVFHQKLSDWDANYCIFGGVQLTSKIGIVRKRLEKENDWDKKEITPKDLDDLYIGLLNIEHELKKEGSASIWVVTNYYKV